MSDPPRETGNAPRVRVWDLPTRLFHWGLAILILLQYGTAEWHWLSMDWHMRFGYATLALVLFRIGWGFAGSQTARFAGFVRGPLTVLRHLRETLGNRETRWIGHNPLGGWSVLALLLCLLVQTISGLFSSDDISVTGPLGPRVSGVWVSRLTAIHKFNQNLLLVLIALHVAAVLVHFIASNDDLISPMLHGHKRWRGASALRFAPWWRALAILGVAALIVWGVVAWGETR